MQNCGPATAHAWDEELREVAGYHLLRRVGEGSMSRVFLSYDVAAGANVAVKLLADHLAHSREFVGRFYREARLSRLLIHRNLVRGVGAGYDPVAGKNYLILEFIDGPTAQTVLARDSKFPVCVAVQVGIDIAHALAFLHSRQYVHRDIKPDNILLHPDGLAKLADLGLAKRLNDDPNITSTQHGVGTSYYMAYEQRSTPTSSMVEATSSRLGATLYHLLTGHVPSGATHEDVIREKEHDAASPHPRFNPEVLRYLPRSSPRLCQRLRADSIRRGTCERLEATNSLGRFHPSPPPNQPTREPRRKRRRVPTLLPQMESAATPGTFSNGAGSSSCPPVPGAPSLRRPTSWIPFGTGFAVIAALALAGVLAAATGVVSMPAGWKPAHQPPSESGHWEESGSSTDGLRPTLSQ